MKTILAAFIFAVVAPLGNAQLELDVKVKLYGEVVAGTGAYADLVGAPFVDRFSTQVEPFLDLNGSYLYSARTSIVMNETTVFEFPGFGFAYVEVWNGGSNQYGLTHSYIGPNSFNFGFQLLGSPETVIGKHLKRDVAFDQFYRAEGWIQDASGSMQFEVRSYSTNFAPIPEPSFYGMGAIGGIAAFIVRRKLAVRC